MALLRDLQALVGRSDPPGIGFDRLTVISHVKLWQITEADTFQVTVGVIEYF